MELRLGKRGLRLDRAQVMGILNVTPDSFSDGGKFISPDAALRHAETMTLAGAAIVDVGGESSRPGAAPIPLAEELDRVLPVVEAIASRVDVAISIDTSKPAVMRAAVNAGAAMINDIFALQHAGAVETAAELDAVICLMHMQGTPTNMQKAPVYERLPEDVIAFLKERIDVCGASGIGLDRLVIDPGFGFGKTDAHNLEILAKLQQFADLAVPLLVGLSRKRTLAKLAGAASRDRVAAGIAAAVVAIQKGARIIRTHDVAETIDAIRLLDAVNEAGQQQ